MVRLCLYLFSGIILAPAEIGTNIEITTNKDMNTVKNNWTLGETATLPRKSEQLRKSGSTVYDRCIGSRYICIREASETRRGILMKVLGHTYDNHIKIVNGQPFCKDDRDELFFGVRYFSYPFPSAREVQEALDIIRDNQSLLQKFEEASMHVNPSSTFWVNDTTRNMLFLKKPQYLDSQDGQLYPATAGSKHYRVTFAYFYKDTLSW